MNPRTSTLGCASDTATTRGATGFEIRATRSARYRIYDQIAIGGMASVHLGRLLGPAGFGRTVAIKRLHPAYAQDEHFVARFVDEARTAARVRHPNVVSILDLLVDAELLSVVEHDMSVGSSKAFRDMHGEVLLVMDYVAGVSVSTLQGFISARSARMPPGIASRIVNDLLRGLAAAHEATSESGKPLGIVHRDVSPQNTLVGVDGTTRVVDFGIARATNRLVTTREGRLMGKLGYLAPELLHGAEATQRSDVYSCAAVLWEALAGRRLFDASNEGALVELVKLGDVDPPSKYAAGGLPSNVDDVVLLGLHYDPDKRFPSAADFARALEDVLPPSSTFDVSSYVKALAKDRLDPIAARVAEIESEPPVFASAATESAFRLPAERGSARRQRGPVIALTGGLATALAGTLLYLHVAQGRVAVASVSATPDPGAVEHAERAVDPLGDAGLDVRAAADVGSTGNARRIAPLRSARPSQLPDCRVPYVVDAMGKRTYKRACLQ